MTRHTPTTHTPAPVIYYVQPDARADLTGYTPAELAARRRHDAVLYARWKQRQDAIAERDRKTRRFLLGLGAVIGLGILAALAALGWLLFTALAGIGLPLIAAVVAAVAGLGLFAGHRCITVVQHWH